METNVLVVPDIHGRHEVLKNAFDKYLFGNYDKIILLADYADSFDRSNEDILRCFNLIIEYKSQLKEDLICLIGNHDIQYLLDNNERVKCSGYRPELYGILNPFLRQYKDLFKVSHGIGNYLFTHAGVSVKWYLKHYDVLNKWCDFCGFDKENDMFLGSLLNCIFKTADAPILYECGEVRMGEKGNVGGPLWCDRSELIQSPFPGFVQVVGHTPVEKINKQLHFGSKNTRIKDTVVYFTDVLNTTEKFLKLKIDEK